MHTREIKTPRHIVRFIHNSDLSGDVRVTWQLRDDVTTWLNREEAVEVHEVLLPGFVFLAMQDFSKGKLADALIAFLEQV
jgi:hypothetical protein